MIDRYKLSGADVLEQTTFPGEYIPLIPVYGEEAWRDGKRHLKSLTRRAKDPQYMFNLWRSLEAEMLQKQPLAPVMAAVGQVEDFAQDWLNPNKAGVLRYKTKDEDGNPLPPPQRLAPPQISSGIVNAANTMVDDIKSVMGVYNAALGQQSNEISGVAINARRSEGDTATYHYNDNLNKSIEHLGRVIMSGLPEIYDTPRLVRIIDREEEPKTIGINGEMAQGQERSFDLTKGKYSVRVVTGAPYTTQRQQTAEMLRDLIVSDPQAKLVVGDLLFKYSDVAGSQALAERYKRLIDPKILGEDEQTPDPEKLQLQQAVQESQAIIAQLGEQLKAFQQQLNNKQGELSLKAFAEQQDAALEAKKLALEEEKQRTEAQLKAAEIAIKERELQLKESEMKQRHQPAFTTELIDTPLS